MLPIKVEFEVITYDFLVALQADVDAGKIQPFVYYGVDDNGYINLAIWIKEIERFIKEQQNIIIYYEGLLEVKD